MNKFIGIGHLTKDGEMKQLNTGVACYKNTIALNHHYKKQDGSKEQETCFLDFVCFARAAEIMQEYLQKGSKVLLEGRLRQENWQDKDGNKKSKIVLMVENVEFMDSKKDSQDSQYNYNQSAPPQKPMPKPQATYSLDSLENSIESVLKKFTIQDRTDSSAVVFFKGTQSELDYVRKNWDEVYKQVVINHNLKGLKIDIKKEIIDELDEIPF